MTEISHPRTPDRGAVKQADALTPRAAHAGPAIIMCPPDHFDVTYQINPWMDMETWVSERETWRMKAHAQWTHLKQTYERLGHTVMTIAPQPGLPDMVFTANCAVVHGNKAVLAHFRHPQRQQEEPHYKAFFEANAAQLGIEHFIPLPGDLVLEGNGDAVWDAHRGFYWVGHSQRSSARAPQVVAQTLDVQTVALEMVNPRFYHLDVALAPLTNGHVVYLPEAFSPEGLEEITSRVGPDLLIAASLEDAGDFAVNLVCLGRDVIMSGGSDQLRAQIAAAGYDVHIVETDAFQLAGGSCFCLTFQIDPSRAA